MIWPEERLCFRKNVLKTLFPETCGFAQTALRKTLTCGLENACQWRVV
jgi:hypothetical protein